MYFESVAKIPSYADRSFFNFKNGEKMKHPSVHVTEAIFKLNWTEKSIVIEEDCEVSLRSSSQQPPVT